MSARRRSGWRDEGWVGGHWGSRGSGVLFCSGRQVLLLQRLDGTWGIPGGARPVNERGEHRHVLGSALDEVAEELGSVPPHEILRSTDFVHEDFSYRTLLARVSPRVRERWQPCLNWEHTDWFWYGRGALVGLRLHPGVAEGLERLRPWG